MTPSPWHLNDTESVAFDSAAEGEGVGSHFFSEEGG